jgi:hypothetical protein
MTTPAGEPNGKPEALDANPATSDTILTPPGTQYRATRGKAEKRNRLRYGGFANPYNSQPPLTAH